MSFTFHRLKKWLAAALGRTADWALFIGIVLICGLGSSWYMVEAGSSLTTVTVGPWTSWTATARPDADPYTRAHHARLGGLPLSTEFAQTFIARTDSDGRSLHSSCTYVLEGREIPSHWWSLTVFNADGRLIQNAPARHAFTRDTVALNPDGSFTASLSRDARPGNWLPTGGAGRVAIVFSAIDLGIQAVARDGEIEELLPRISRTQC